VSPVFASPHPRREANSYAYLNGWHHVEKTPRGTKRRRATRNDVIHEDDALRPHGHGRE
jgi:hypothetical protein